MTAPSWLDPVNPDDTAQCAECDGDLVIYRNETGEVIGDECNTCEQYKRWWQMVTAQLQKCIDQAPPRALPQHPHAGCPCTDCRNRDDRFEAIAERRQEARTEPVEGREADRRADRYHERVAGWAT